MTKTLTNATAAELQQQLEALKAKARGDMAVALVDAVKNLDEIIGETWPPADVPTDLRVFREMAVSTIQSFSSIADREVAAPEDPNVVPPPPPPEPE
jgi:hypothetical protein